jgi:prophage regulatory protein
MNNDASARLLSRREVEARNTRSRSWIYAAMQRGEFPRPVETSAATVGWIEAEISEWVRSRPRRSYEGSTKRPTKRRPTKKGRTTPRPRDPSIQF